jgi:hypothetical protein
MDRIFILLSQAGNQLLQLHFQVGKKNEEQN